MDYIVLDLEWNQPPEHTDPIRDPIPFDSEIIEIGAVRLNDRFETVDEYKGFVKPVFYPVLAGRVARLTRISKTALRDAPEFPAALQAFWDWCGEEFSFMSWSRTDITVLVDNMLMHGLDPDPFPVCYDLQRIFGREIMGDERQCSLEKAMDVLGLAAERSHDALNDVRNTVKIANCLDLENHLGEYALTFVGLGADRSDPFFLTTTWPSLAEAVASEEVQRIVCPYCGQELLCGDFVPGTRGSIVGYAQCDEGDEYYVRFSSTLVPNVGVRVRRMTLEMSDDLWDLYMDARDRRDSGSDSP